MSTTMKATKDGTTISKETYEALRSSILLAQIAPGTKLTTSDLCERFGASLGAVREALSHLHAEGLVIAEARRGYTVSPISVADLRDLTQVRIDVEVLCLTRSIEHGEIEWEASLVAAAHRLAKNYRENFPDGSRNEAFETAHDGFHLALVSACGNPRLLRIRQQLFAESERYRRVEASIGRARDAAEEHRLIAKATLARNAKKASELLAEHIARTAEDIIGAMSDKEAANRRTPRKAAKSR